MYREPLCRRHYAGLLSAPVALRTGVLIGSVVLAFATGGFWGKATWELEQPTVHYTGDALAIFEVRAADIGCLGDLRHGPSRRQQQLPRTAGACHIQPRPCSPRLRTLPARVQGAQGEVQVWATSPALQDALGAQAAAVSAQAGELDANLDGRPDAIHLTARLAGTAPVHSVKLLLQFTYALEVRGIRGHGCVCACAAIANASIG